MPVRETSSDRPTNEITILGRVLSNGEGMSPALARHLLRLGFSAEDQARINEIAERNRRGTPAPAEQRELRDYANAGCWPGSCTPRRDGR